MAPALLLLLFFLLLSPPSPFLPLLFLFLCRLTLVLWGSLGAMGQSELEAFQCCETWIEMKERETNKERLMILFVVNLLNLSKLLCMFF